MKSGWICGRPAIFKLGDDCEWLQDFVRVIGKLMACRNNVGDQATTARKEAGGESFVRERNFSENITEALEL